MRKESLEFLKTLLVTPSPGGYESKIQKVWCDYVRPYADEIRTDSYGNAVAIRNPKGSPVVICSHALSGLERSVAKKHSGVYPVLLIADTLRLLGQGTKVGVEVAVMAADAGTLTGKDIIAIGGSGGGADTALVVKQAHMNNFFDLRIREIICKPREF